MSGSPNRKDEIGRFFLFWLRENSSRNPNPEEFIDETPTLAGESISESDFENVVSRAVHFDMVKGFSAGSRAMPLRVRLLPAGDECLDYFNGSMHAFREARVGGASTVHNDNRVTVTANDNVQVVAHARDAVQRMTVSSINAERLREVGEAAQEIADILPASVRREVSDAGRELVVASDDPVDIEGARSAGERLLAALTASSAAFTVVRFIIDALSGGLGG